MILSIIIPTYNEEKYLPILLKSIRKQKFKNYEIIVADANSTDKTAEIAKKYNCKIVEGGMPAKGRNNGAKIAKGKYLLFLDSDLQLTDNFLKDMIKEFEEEKVGIAIGQMKALSESYQLKLAHDFANMFMKASENIKPHGAGCYGIITKKEFHEKYNGFNEKLTFGEDSDYIHRIGKKEGFKVLRNAKVGVSTRRIEEDGLSTVLKQYGKSTVRDYLGLKTDAEDLHYDFEHEKKVLSKRKTIFYCICGEGMGHAIRSKVIIENLIKKYDIYIFSSNNAYNYLNEKFDNVYEIGCFNTVYENNKVNNTKTFVKAMKENPNNLKEGYNIIYKKAKHLKPNIMITDFENYGSMVATILNIPLISIDNIHMISDTKIDYPQKFYIEMLKAKTIIKTYVPKSKIHILTSFFYPKVRSDKKAILFPPVLREEIFKLKPEDNNYILVYQTSKESIKLIKKLKRLDENFIVYGFNKEETDENLTFKLFNDNVFFEDLSKAKAVICNGGFTLISESIYLKKPIFSIPAQGNFEQILNGFYVQKLGFGEFNETMNIKKIAKFLTRLDKYKTKLNKIKKTNNEGILKEIEYCIEKYSK